MTRVKDMSRRQQKAVFANLGNKPSSVSNMNARRQSLLSNDLASESQQDKIEEIMRNNKLTHRQKMDRIARLKNKGSSRHSTTTVPVGVRDTNVESPGIRLIYKKALDKAEKRRLQRKAYLKKHPGAVFEPTKEPGVYLLKEKGKVFKWKDGIKTKLDSTLYLVKFVDKGTKQSGFKEVTAKSKKGARKILLSEKKNIGIVRINKVKKKDLGYKELKKAGINLKPNADYDGDGVKNSKDCRPMNKKKQDLFDDAMMFGFSVAKKGAKVGGKYAKRKLYERTAKGRAEIAQRKIDKIEAKERGQQAKQRARRLEQKAKEMEIAYKKAHPKKFGLF